MTGTDPLARAVFAALVLACFAAFFVTQRLKHTPAAVQNFKLTPRFTPASAGEARLEGISFKLAHADEVTVTILDSSGDIVATLVRDWPVARYKQFSLRWNGRVGVAHGYTLVHIAGRSLHGGVTSVLPVNEGRIASAGEYRIRVSLRRQRLSRLSPRSFTLVR